MRASPSIQPIARLLRIALPNGESYEGTLTQIEGAQPFVRLLE